MRRAKRTVLLGGYPVFARLFVRLVLCTISIVRMAGRVAALDEGILTPTTGASVSQDEQEFQDAMAVWFKHDYKNGEKMLKEFARV